MLPIQRGPFGEEYPFARRYRVAFVRGDVLLSLSRPTGTMDPTRRVIPLPPGPCGTKRIVYATQNIMDSSGCVVDGRESVFYVHSERTDDATMLDDNVPDMDLGPMLREEVPHSAS